jgi:hypothetical protein
MARSASRNLTTVKLLVAATSALFLTGGCNQSGSEEAAQAFSQQGGQTQATLPTGHPDISGTPPANGPAVAAVAGLAWSVPAEWQTGAERPMRAATYLVSPGSGDSEGAECAVFHFGSDQGGDVESNVQRWIGQFEQPDGTPSSKVAKTSHTDLGDLKVTTVEVGGTYTASMGPMSGTKSNRENYRLLGAIVEGPQGAVFFNLTGPSRTVEAARVSFDGMLKSVHRESAS